MWLPHAHTQFSPALKNSGCSPYFTCELLNLRQGGAQNDPVFDLVVIIQPCNERCFVTQ
jgi:hypothetical protein